MKAAKAFRGLTCILSLLLAISIGLTSGMFSAEGHINRFLGIETTVLVPKAEGVGQAASARYPSSFSADIAHYTAEEEDAKSKAADDIALEKKKAINEAKDEISELAMAIAGKVVARELNDADQDGMIDRFIEELGDQK